MALAPGYRLAAVHGGAPGDLDDLLTQVARSVQARGLRVAGAIQHNTERPGRRCDMDLTILPGGAQFRISEDRGRLSQGCRLDAGGLSQAVHALERGLEHPFDVMILNKFGAREAEGAGFAPALAQAVLAGVPVLIGASPGKHPALEAFVGASVPVLTAEAAALLSWVETARTAAQV